MTASAIGEPAEIQPKGGTHLAYQERCYSVLVVCGVQKFLDALMPMLPETEYSPVCIAANAAAARRELLRRSFDFIIINAPLPDEFGTRFAIDASQCPGSVVLLLVRAEVYEQTNAKVLSQGIFTLAKPTPAQTLQQSLKWMAAARERMRRLEKRASTVEEKMEEIRLVNRAKWLLIETYHMSEPDAHRCIEKQAMDRCTSRKEIAQEILHSIP